MTPEPTDEIASIRWREERSFEQRVDVVAFLLARLDAMTELVTSGADTLEAIVKSKWADEPTRLAAVELWRHDFRLILGKATP